MKLLALDTATEACSAALWLDGHVGERYTVPGRGHAERLLPMVDELLAEAGVTLAACDAIAFGRGPGAFTGVRIAVALAQGLALGADRPVVPVSDLAALAWGALYAAAPEAGGAEKSVGAPGSVAGPVEAALVCLDARMGEVYWAEAMPAGGGGVVLRREALGLPSTVTAASARLVGAGPGWSSFPVLLERFRDRLAAVRADLLPRAAWIAQLAVPELAAGRVVDAAFAEPLYLRDQVAMRSGRVPGGGIRLGPHS